MAGLALDPWQQQILAHSLGETKKHKWAAFEVAVVVPRQNGKTLLAVARALVGLFLLDERLIIHSAHQFDTSLEAFRSLIYLIEETPEFSKKVKRVSRSHGEEGIELYGGQRVRFRTRTKGGGRGFTSDCLILDEAMILPETTVGALLPTLSARPNPQVWYLGSAPDEEIHEEAIALTRLRERARKPKRGDSLAYFEWAADFNHPSEITLEDAESEKHWARANPGLRRIGLPHIAREQRSMDPRTFAVERMGVGAWPDPSQLGNRPISPEAWAACADKESVPLDPVCFSYDVSQDRRSASIAVAGRRDDDRWHVEVVANGKGVDWVAPALQTAVERNPGCTVLADTYGPGASLLPELDERNVIVETINTTDYAASCGHIFDCVDQDLLRHRDERELHEAIAGAVKRPLSDRWAWSRLNSGVDISPLVAVTLALWGVRTAEPQYATLITAPPEPESEWIGPRPPQMVRAEDLVTCFACSQGYCSIHKPDEEEEDEPAPKASRRVREPA